jgi:anaerobic selenocysteine-containing dehydrogenase
MKTVVHAACPHDCPDACGVLITVEDGRAVRIQGDAAHPVTRGFLCAKVAKYLDRVYSGQRVLYPMRRVAGKGEGKGAFADFERITWDRALDEMAARLKQIVAEYGSEAVLPYSYGGTLAMLGNASMDRRFFHRLGASRLERTICSSAGGEGMMSVYGCKLGTEPEQFRHARYIIGWAENFHGNNVHLWPFVEEARRSGARLVVIDPYRTRSAALADWHIPINPGTDVALALGMMHVIIGEKLYDAEYISKYTLGFEQLAARVAEYPPERVAQWTGVPAADIVKLGREYATVRPAAIRLNYGVQRCENGGMATRAICMLPCLTGSWKDVGGGLVLTTSGAFQFDRAALERPDLLGRSGLGQAPRAVNMVELGRALNELDDPPIKAMIVYNSNPAAVAPDHNAVVRGLRRPDLFTVVHEQFLIDTADYADIVLPATTFFEHKDIQASYGHYFLQMSHPAMAPLGECRSNVEWFRALAERMGFDEACFRESVEEMMDAALASRSPFLEGIGRERLEREGHVRLNFHRRDAETQGNGEFFLPFAHGGFQTPSGKAELYSEALAAKGLDPVAAFVAPVESRHAVRVPPCRSKTGSDKGGAPAELPPAYPLELLARKNENFLNSTFCNLESLQAMEEPGLLEISAVDAAARGISEGEAVRVFNPRGEMVLRARISEAVQAGVVAARLNWAKLSGGVNINALTSQRLTDLGRGPTFFSVMVEVMKM